VTSKIFFSVDVHGSTTVWRKWIRAADVYKADFLILAGDLTGKVLVPLIKHPDGSLTARYYGRRWILRSDAELRDFMERLEGSGVYYRIVTERELEELKASPRLVASIVDQAMCERLRSWLELLVQRIDLRKITVVVMPGNDDELVVDNVIREFEDKGIVYPLDRVFEIEGHEVISLSEVNPTPWNTPRELQEKDLERKVERLVSTIANPPNAVFNFHCPPYGTHLDLAPKLTKDLKPITIAGAVQYDHVGSKAIRKAIERHGPLLGLHGHIHESSGMDRVGRTLVLNPGSEYGEGVLRGFVVEVDKKEILKYWKVEG